MESLSFSSCKLSKLTDKKCFVAKQNGNKIDGTSAIYALSNKVNLKCQFTTI